MWSFYNFSRCTLIYPAGDCIGNVLLLKGSSGNKIRSSSFLVGTRLHIIVGSLVVCIGFLHFCKQRPLSTPLVSSFESENFHSVLLKALSFCFWTWKTLALPYLKVMQIFFSLAFCCWILCSFKHTTHFVPPSTQSLCIWHQQRRIPREANTFSTKINKEVVCGEACRALINKF